MATGISLPGLLLVLACSQLLQQGYPTTPRQYATGHGGVPYATGGIPPVSAPQRDEPRVPARYGVTFEVEGGVVVDFELGEVPVTERTRQVRKLLCQNFADLLPDSITPIDQLHIVGRADIIDHEGSMTLIIVNFSTISPNSNSSSVLLRPAIAILQGDSLEVLKQADGWMNFFH